MFQKVIQSNQKEILHQYYYIKRYNKRVNEISFNSKIKIKIAKSIIYKKVKLKFIIRLM